MKTLCFNNGPIFNGKECLLDTAVIIHNGRISGLCHSNQVPQDAEIYDLKGGILAPGFIDIQSNGGCGLLFNTSPDIETVEALIACHRKHGTTMLFPTLISTNTETMLLARHAVEQAFNSGMTGLGGLHFEGPFLNSEKKGIHNEQAIREVLEEDISRLLCPLTRGHLLITLAPETIPVNIAKHLAHQRVRLLAGHSNALFEQAYQAFENGVTGVTHLYNAMSQFGSREPGLVGAALSHHACWCTIIVDGFHVHPATLKLSMKAKGINKFILVTDSMPSSGSMLSEYQLDEHIIYVKDGRCSSADGTLAGSNLTMIDAVKNCVNILDLPLEHALAMASFHPAEFLGISDRYGCIAEGAEADLVHLDSNLNVVTTWIHGECAV